MSTDPDIHICDYKQARRYRESRSAYAVELTYRILIKIAVHAACFEKRRELENPMRVEDVPITHSRSRFEVEDHEVVVPKTPGTVAT